MKNNFQKPGYYKTQGYCTNCDFKGDLWIKKGDRIPKFGRTPFFSNMPVKCPQCGCSNCYGN